MAAFHSFLIFLMSIVSSFCYSVGKLILPAVLTEDVGDGDACGFFLAELMCPGSTGFG